MDIVRAFFPKLKHFFDFYKKVGEGSPLTLVARLPCLDEAKVSNINSDLTWMKTLNDAATVPHFSFFY